MLRKGYSVFEVIHLFLQSFLGKLTGEERQRYEQMMSEQGLLNNCLELSDREYILSELRKKSCFHREDAYGKLNDYIRQHKTKRMSERHLLWSVAVVLLLLSVGGGYLFFQIGNRSAQVAGEVIPSVSSKAYVTLANGKKVGLAQNSDRLTEKDGTVIVCDSATLVYPQTKHQSVNELIYNELSVPCGGEYMLMLADGTKVWMNADSYLKYPVQFAGGQREVMLRGEAYFEVAKDTEKPFLVNTSLGIIRVLGTEFNVRDYGEERMVVTTLVRGCVRYEDRRNPDKMVSLDAGFQLSVDGVCGAVNLQKVNLQEYVGWKDGLYVFSNLTLSELMKTIERTYDVSVFFVSEDLKKLRFSGDLQKYERVELFLRYVETGGDVRFEMKNRTISVYRK